MSITKRVAAVLAPRATQLTPGLTSAFVHRALDKAIVGVGPLPSASASAERALREADGDVERAIHTMIETHVRYAGAQGFLTNIGGLVALAVTVPVNLSGLALIQCHLVAAIAHLRGYDLADPRTRVAILACVLGEERLMKMVKTRTIPGTPMELAAAAYHDPELDRILATEVAAELVTRATGKRLAATVGRRVPVMGGLVGAGTDSYVTWKIGRYVDREFLPRRTRR